MVVTKPMCCMPVNTEVILLFANFSALKSLQDICGK